MSDITRLYLIRHGEVEERYHHIFGGRIDMELSDRGREQAELMAAYLKNTPFDAYYTSPMKQARQTWEHLNSVHPHPTVILEDLREVDFGAWTGLRWDEVYDRFQVAAFDWLTQLDLAAIPDAESGPQFRARVQPCLDRILERHHGKTVGVVCHGGVIRMLMSILLDLPLPKKAAFEIDYASISILDVTAGKTVVQLLNFTPWRDLP